MSDFFTYLCTMSTLDIDRDNEVHPKLRIGIIANTDSTWRIIFAGYLRVEDENNEYWLMPVREERTILPKSDVGESQMQVMQITQEIHAYMEALKLRGSWNAEYLKKHARAVKDHDQTPEDIRLQELMF